MKTETYSALRQRVDNLSVPSSGAQVRHYRGAVALYESRMRQKYGRADFWRVYLRSEADHLSSLRKSLLIKVNFINEFYAIARSIAKTEDRAWVEALAEFAS
jgi:hypothetical protein